MFIRFYQYIMGMKSLQTILTKGIITLLRHLIIHDHFMNQDSGND